MGILLTFIISCFRINPRGIQDKNSVILKNIILLPGNYLQGKTNFRIIPIKTNLLSLNGTEQIKNNNPPARISVRKEFIIDKKTNSPIISTNSNKNESLTKNSIPINEKIKSTCNICFKKFSWKCNLKKHYIRKHTDNYEFSCKECDKQFKISCELKRHMRQKHKKEINLQDGLPSRKKRRITETNEDDPLSTENIFYDVINLNNENNKNENQISTNNKSQNEIDINKSLNENKSKIICKTCSKCFASKTTWKTHFIRMHTDNYEFSCEECGKQFKIWGDLRYHMRLKHKKEDETSQDSLSTRKKKRVRYKRIDPLSTNNEIFCKNCNKKFNSFDEFNIHIDNIHMKILESQKNNDYQLKCNECGDEFKKKRSLIRHLQTHNMIKPVKKYNKNEICTCEVCGIKVLSKSTLKIHYLRKHSQEFNFPCKQCNKVFKVRGDLTTHTRLNHKEPTAICEICGKITKNKQALYVHQKYSHFKTEFICPICKKCMASKENLNQHVNIYHAKKERLFCDICKNSFMNKSSLRNHITIVHYEKTFACETCGKLFGRGYQLRQHLLTHTNLRPYICRLCGKQFKQKLSLLIHIKSHPDEHPPIPTVNVDNLLKNSK